MDLPELNTEMNYNHILSKMRQAVREHSDQTALGEKPYMAVKHKHDMVVRNVTPWTIYFMCVNCGYLHMVDKFEWRRLVTK